MENPCPYSAARGSPFFGNFSLCCITLLAPLFFGGLVSVIYMNHTLYNLPMAICVLDKSQAAHVLPITYFVNSFRSVYLAGASFSHIYPDFLVLFAFLCLNIAISWWAIRRMINSLHL